MINLLKCGAQGHERSKWKLCESWSNIQSYFHKIITHRNKKSCIEMMTDVCLHACVVWENNIYMEIRKFFFKHQARDGKFQNHWNPILIKIILTIHNHPLSQ